MLLFSFAAVSLVTAKLVVTVTTAVSANKTLVRSLTTVLNRPLFLVRFRIAYGTDLPGNRAAGGVPFVRLAGVATVPAVLELARRMSAVRRVLAALRMRGNVLRRAKSDI